MTGLTNGSHTDLTSIKGRLELVLFLVVTFYFYRCLSRSILRLVDDRGIHSARMSPQRFLVSQICNCFHRHFWFQDSNYASPTCQSILARI